MLSFFTESLLIGIAAAGRTASVVIATASAEMAKRFIGIPIVVRGAINGDARAQGSTAEFTAGSSSTRIKRFDR